jgi:monothiol bacilliredoxin
MARTTLPERLFRLHDPAAVDRLLDGFEWAVVFKAGSGDKTVEAWLVVQRALEPRTDVPVGLLVLPADRPASEQVSARAGIPHRSPQILLFRRARPLFHLDEFAITPDRLEPLLHEHLPPEHGLPVVNDEVVTVAPYRALLAAFVQGDLPEPRFTWAYLERLRRDAVWRDEESFELLNSLFENRNGRDVNPAGIVAVEFQGHLAGRLEPLEARARRLLERLDARIEARRTLEPRRS